jgi:type III pantothenate kinase
LRYIIIDIGNTSVKLGVFDNESLVKMNRYSLSDFDPFNFLEEKDSPIIISASGNGFPYDFSSFSNCLWFNYQTKIPIKLNYKTPETLGLDRIASSVGAYSSNQDSLIIDLGTCVTYDLVDRHGFYQGGHIVPGIDMRFKAMKDYTNKLPYISDWRETWGDRNGIGKSTYECLSLGIKESMRMEISGMMNHYKETYPDLRIFVTGGDAVFFDKEFKNSIFAVPELVLIGLQKILQHNI